MAQAHTASAPGAPAPHDAAVDERVASGGALRRLLIRPEIGAIAGAVVVWAYFAAVASDRGFTSMRGAASYLEVGAELGILAVAVAC
jgi:simple sugar transport system permease protein